MRVETVRIERQLVAVVAGHEHAGRRVVRSACERLPQPGDVDLHGLGGGGRRALSPKLVDQPVGAERLVGVQQKQSQQRALLASSQPDRAALIEGLEGA